jgi:hypothetical protein
VSTLVSQVNIVKVSRIGLIFYLGPGTNVEQSMSYEFVYGLNFVHIHLI